MFVAGDKEPEDISKRKTVIYVRQKLGSRKNVEERAENLRSYLIRNGISIDMTFTDSSDFFICNARQRPNLYKLIDLVESNRVSTIYTYSLNDISIVFFSIFEYICKLHKTKIVAVTSTSLSEEEKQEVRIGLGKLIAYFRKIYNI